MKTFKEIFSQDKKILSFEFFPPKKAELLGNTKSLMTALSKYNPDFMTVTYGAGGGTREYTKDLVSFIANDLGRASVSHLTCVGHTKAELIQIVKELKSKSITNILALRGDNFNQTGESLDDFTCAKELVEFLLSQGIESIAVAGYPEVHKDAKSADDDIAYLCEKESAGATLIITQLFFDSKMYFDFVNRARNVGIKSPIIPGLMPVSNVKQLEKFTSMCGASIPAKLLGDLKSIENENEKVIAYGIDYACKQVAELLEGGAPGIHFYTLNKLNQVQEILARTGSYFA